MFQRFTHFFSKHHGILTDSAISAAITGTTYSFISSNYPEKIARDHVSFYKRKLTQEELNQIKTNPHKSRECLDKCKEELRLSMRLD